MTTVRPSLTTALALGAGLAFGAAAANAAEKPVHGGILEFVVGSTIPSYDGHQETTFGVIHPLGPMYSLLIRVDPQDPMDPMNLVCDLCEGKWQVSNDGMTYTFKIKQNVKFHDGHPLTAADVKATLDKIVFPPEGVTSARKSWYEQIAEITTPDQYTLVIQMKRPVPAILPALASPFNFVYSKKDLDEHGYKWHQRNVNGTGPFIFVQEQPGAFVEAKKNPDYHVEGLPYLDGFRAIQAPKLSIRLQAIRGDRAAAEFRGFPPKAIDDLKRALGDKVVVQQSDWNVVMGVTPNQRKERFQDVRVRQALGHALDRHGTIDQISQIAIVRSIGGIFFPNHPLAAKTDQLVHLPGYSKDIEAERKKARALLKEAGQENVKVTLWNRAVDQPYAAIGTWLVDQWRRVGVDADQTVVPSGPWFAGRSTTRDFDVSIDFNAQTIVNPIIDVSFWMCEAGNNISNCEDPKPAELYHSLLFEADPEQQFKKARAFEDYVLGETAQYIPAFWWYRLIAHRDYFKGWKISPSHYLVQQLDDVWIDPKLR